MKDPEILDQKNNQSLCIQRRLFKQTESYQDEIIVIQKR